MFEGGTNVYNNWIDLGLGGFWTGGNKAQAQALRRASRGAFGGIEDFRYQQTIDKSTLTIDGRALFDQKDYKLSLDLRRDEVGYLRLSYDQFRTWSNGDGGYYPPAHKWYPLTDDALALDRGNLAFEVGFACAEIGVNAVLYEAQIPLRELMKLEVGHTLTLDVKPDALVSVRCGNVTLTEGRMGRVGDKVAVRIAKPLRKPKTTFAMFEKADESTAMMEAP